MKKFLALFLAMLTLLSCAACGGPADTTVGDDTVDPVTDAPEVIDPETDAPETNAPETNASETDAFDTPTDVGGGDTKEYIFNYTFDNVSSLNAESPDGFALGFHQNLPFELVGGENGYVKNSTDDGYLAIHDNNFLLPGKSFIFEAEMTFTSFPVEREQQG